MTEQPTSAATTNEPCRRCRGCGQLANSDDREPWTDWTSLPAQSQLAIRMGLVAPEPCDECDGTAPRHPCCCLPGGRPMSALMRRHPAEVTADRLAEALDKWPDAFDGEARDMVGYVRHVLHSIAEQGSPVADKKGRDDA